MPRGSGIVLRYSFVAGGGLLYRLSSRPRPWPPRPISWHFVPRRTGCFAQVGTPTLGPVEAAPPRSRAGIAAERRDLEALHRDGRIDKAALEAGLAALAVMARTRRLAERHRR